MPIKQDYRLFYQICVITSILFSIISLITIVLTPEDINAKNIFHHRLEKFDYFTDEINPNEGKILDFSLILSLNEDSNTSIVEFNIYIIKNYNREIDRNQIIHWENNPQEYIINELQSTYFKDFTQEIIYENNYNSIFLESKPPEKGDIFTIVFYCTNIQMNSEFIINYERSALIRQEFYSKNVIFILIPLTFLIIGISSIEILNFMVRRKNYLKNPLIIQINEKLKEKKKKELFSTFDNDIQQKFKEEHNSILNLMKCRLWKDSCVKMGILIEGALTFWGIEKGGILTIQSSRRTINFNEKKTDFQKKIHFMLKGGYSEYNLGDLTSWRMVDNIIRDYRNYVHLQKYIKIKNPLGKTQFEQLVTVYTSIITDF